MKMIDGWLHVTDKPIEEMNLKEAEIERRAHGWARHKLKTNAWHLKTKEYALENSILTKEQYTKMYEDGEMSYGKYRSMPPTMARKKKDLEVTKAQIQYGFALVELETAVCTALDERITLLRAKQKKIQVPVHKRINPYKQGHAINNPKPWLKSDVGHPLVTIKMSKPKWTAVGEAGKSAEYVQNRLSPIEEWDLDKLRAIADDRGYHHDVSMYAYIGQELDLPVHSTKLMLQSGKLTWSQCILIGALFEMTPAEFCDVFLSGYFQEVVDGKFVATVEDKSKLLDPPRRFRATVGSIAQEENESEE